MIELLSSCQRAESELSNRECLATACRGRRCLPSLMLRAPGHVGHRFRRMPTDPSDGSRPPILDYAGYPDSLIWGTERELALLRVRRALMKLIRSPFLHGSEL